MMQVVELYVTEGCGLCKEVKKLLKEKQRTTPFELKEILLHPDHPKYNEYFLSVPVVVVDGTHELRAVTAEGDLSGAIAEVPKPSASFYTGKFLEALGMVTVAFGFVYGLLGDMWMDLYFFLAGIGIFVLGRVLEKRDQKRLERLRNALAQSSNATSLTA
jgi:glutaredoxin